MKGLKEEGYRRVKKRKKRKRKTPFTPTWQTSKGSYCNILLHDFQVLWRLTYLYSFVQTTTTFHSPAQPQPGSAGKLAVCNTGRYTQHICRHKYRHTQPALTWIERRAEGLRFNRLLLGSLKEVSSAKQLQTAEADALWSTPIPGIAETKAGSGLNKSRQALSKPLPELQEQPALWVSELGTTDTSRPAADTERSALTH